MHFRVEPSPSGGYVVRLEGHDVPVSRHDTEEDADEWIARHTGTASPEDSREAERRQAVRPHFGGLDDGTQILLRSPRPADARGAGACALVAVHPASGAVIGRTDAACREVWIDPAWAGRGVDALLRQGARSL